MTEWYRASDIHIEIPKEHSEPWIHLTINKLFKDDDGKLVNEIPRFAYISKPMSEIATNIYEYTDLVLKERRDISGYGLSLAITEYVDKCLKERYVSS